MWLPHVCLMRVVGCGNRPAGRFRYTLRGSPQGPLRSSLTSPRARRAARMPEGRTETSCKMVRVTAPPLSRTGSATGNGHLILCVPKRPETGLHFLDFSLR